MEKMIGVGGGPIRCSTLPTEGAARKTFPMATGLLDYFPDALAAVSHVSWKGNEQHNPGQPLHWARGKSADEADTLVRHLAQRGTLDTDGVRHSAKVAWRALALLQKEIEEAEATAPVVVTFVCPQDGEENCCEGRPDLREQCLAGALRRTTQTGR